MILAILNLSNSCLWKISILKQMRFACNDVRITTTRQHQLTAAVTGQVLYSDFILVVVIDEVVIIDLIPNASTRISVFFDPFIQKK